MIKCDLFVAPIKIKLMWCLPVLVLVFLPITAKEQVIDDIRVKIQEPEFELSGYISVNFWSREMKFGSCWRGIRIIRVRVNRVKMTEKWAQIQGKFDLVRVRGEFELACEQALLFGRVKRVSRERARERRSREGQRKGELATIPYKFSFVLRLDEGKYHWLKNGVPEIKVDW